MTSNIAWTYHLVIKPGFCLVPDVIRTYVTNYNTVRSVVCDIIWILEFIFESRRYFSLALGYRSFEFSFFPSKASRFTCEFYNLVSAKPLQCVTFCWRDNFLKILALSWINWKCENLIHTCVIQSFINILGKFLKRIFVVMFQVLLSVFELRSSFSILFVISFHNTVFNINLGLF